MTNIISYWKWPFISIYIHLLSFIMSFPIKHGGSVHCFLWLFTRPGNPLVILRGFAAKSFIWCWYFPMNHGILQTAMALWLCVAEGCGKIMENPFPLPATSLSETLVYLCIHVRLGQYMVSKEPWLHISCDLPMTGTTRLKNENRNVDFVDFVWLVVTGTFGLFVHSVGNNTPNWRTHIFQRGRYTTNHFP